MAETASERRRLFSPISYASEGRIVLQQPAPVVNLVHGQPLLGSALPGSHQPDGPRHRISYAGAQQSPAQHPSQIRSYGVKAHKQMFTSARLPTTICIVSPSNRALTSQEKENCKIGIKKRISNQPINQRFMI